MGRFSRADPSTPSLPFAPRNTGRSSPRACRTCLPGTAWWSARAARWRSRRGRALSRRGPRVRPPSRGERAVRLGARLQGRPRVRVADAFRDACDAHAEEPRLRALALKRYLCGMTEKEARSLRAPRRAPAGLRGDNRAVVPVAAGHAADGTLLVTCTRSGAKAATAWPPRWAPGERGEARGRFSRRAGTPPTPPTPREGARIFSARPRRARRAKRGSPPSSSRSTPLWARRRRPSASLFQAGRARRRAPSGAAAARRARPRRTPRGRRRARPRTRLPSPRGCSTCPPAASCTGGSTCSRSSSAPSGEAPRAPGRARAPPPRPKARAKARATVTRSRGVARGIGIPTRRRRGRRRTAPRAPAPRRTETRRARVEARSRARARAPRKPAAVLGHGVAGGRGVELAQKPPPRRPSATARRLAGTAGDAATEPSAWGKAPSGRREARPRGTGTAAAPPPASFRAALERSHSMEGSGSPTRGGLTRAFASSGLT